MRPSSLPSRLESPSEIPPRDDTHHRRARGRIGHDRDRADPMVHHEGNRLDRGLDGVERDDARAHDGTDRGHPRVLERRDKGSVRQQIDLEEVRARYEPNESSGVGDDRKAVVVVFGHQVRQRLDGGLWSHRDGRSGHQVADRNIYDLSHGVLPPCWPTVSLHRPGHRSVPSKQIEFTMPVKINGTANASSFAMQQHRNREHRAYSLWALHPDSPTAELSVTARASS